MSRSPGARRPLALTVIAALLLSVLPAGIAAASLEEVCEGAPERDFTDRDSISAVFVDVVDCMAAYGITIGFPDGRFGPGESVTRQQMALFIARFVAQAEDGTTDIPSSTSDAFTDLGSGVPDAQRDAINWLAELGITTGVTATTYDPGGTVSRQQMASFITRALSVTGGLEGVSLPELIADFDGEPFTDLDEVSAAHRTNVQVLQALGVVVGRADGSYGPGIDVTRQQMAQFLMRSAGVLAEIGQWNGAFVGVDPEDPDDPDTPATDPDPTDPDDTDPVSPTNQTFAVTADETQVPLDTEVEITAEVDDAELVTLWLIDPDYLDVDDDGDTILTTFETDNDGDFDPDAVLDPADGIVIAEVDGASVGASTTVVIDDIDDGSIEVLVDADPDGPAAFALLVVATDDEVPEVDDDGAPVDDFGVSDPVAVQDVEGILLLDRDAEPAPVRILGGIDGIGSIVRPVDEDVEVVARLLDLDDPTDSDAAVVELDGSVDYKIAKISAPGLCSTSVTYDNVADALLIEDGTGTVELVSGEAQFTVPGGEANDVYCVLTDWEGEDLYDDQEAGNFAVSSHGAIRFSDATPVPTTATFVGDTDRFVTVGTNVAIEVQVLDQFNNAVSATEVTFSRDVDVFTDSAPQTQDRPVSAATGIASESYGSTANRRDEITAQVKGTAITVPGSVTITWYQAAAGPSPATGEGVDYLGVIERVDDNNGSVIDTGVPGGVAPAGEGPFLRIDYGDADDEYEVLGASVTLPTFRTTITAGANGAVGRVLDVTNYRDGRTSPTATTFNLAAASQFAFTAAGNTGLIAGNDAEASVTSLIDVVGDPISDTIITATLTGAAGTSVTTATTDTGGQAQLTYQSLPGDAGATVGVVLGTQINGRSYQASSVNLVFVEGLVRAELTSPTIASDTLFTGDQITLTFSDTPVVSATTSVVVTPTAGTSVTLASPTVSFTVVANTVVITALVDVGALDLAGEDWVVWSLTDVAIGGQQVVVPTDRRVPVLAVKPPPPT